METPLQWHIPTMPKSGSASKSNIFWLPSGWVKLFESIDEDENKHATEDRKHDLVHVLSSKV